MYLCDVKLWNKYIIALIVTSLSAFSAIAQELDFLNLKANRITMNGADWRGLKRALPQRGEKRPIKFSVVQIGDSHIQPGIMTAQVRAKLQRRYGNGGRGLIAPLALAGTNEPNNYLFRSTSHVTAKSRLMSRSWPVTNGLTGVSVRFGGSSTSLTIRDKSNQPFTSVTIMHAAGGGYDHAVIAGDTITATEVSQWASQFAMPRATAEVTLTALPCPTPFFGALLLNDKPGVVVTDIGNNGATYSLYNKVDDFGTQMQVLRPNLVILSMGTNEAAGNVDVLEPTMDRLIKNIRSANPNVIFLLTTPMEFQKGSGRGYVVNSNAHRARDIIMEYGRKHKIAVWDMFTVCGGDGCSSLWISNGLMNSRDHLHLLNAGYELQGMMLGDALLAALR